MKGETVILTATISYENGGTKNTATWSSSNTSVATVDETGKITAVSTGICTITATLESFSATCNVTVRPSKDDCVDLGLSVKWTTCNVGATSPEDYGDYFAWGETEPYYEPDYAQSSSPVWKSGKSEGYSWPSYKYCEGSFMSITKYCDKSEFGYI